MINLLHTVKNKKVVFVTTFPPRQCGIATFASDLIEGLEQVKQTDFSFTVCNLLEKDKNRQPGLRKEASKEVRKEIYNDRRIEYSLDTFSLEACIELAEALNKDPDLGMVVFEHEFGLYGGEYGSNILSILALLEKPAAIRFHTVLPGPNPILKQTVHHINHFADKIMVMTHNSSDILIRDYGINPEKIEIIPHGIHEAVLEDKKVLKEEFGLGSDTLVMSNFGLLSENKNIEYALQALATVKKSFPKFLFLIIGKTHPSVSQNEGEQYRNRLKDMVKSYGLQQNVQFINRFVSLDELLDFLALTDIYLFTSKDPNQAVSGTLTYAMNAGCAVITTPIAQSKEIISPAVGRVVNYNEPENFAAQILELANNPVLRSRMGKQAKFVTKENTWSNVAVKHLELFSTLMQTNQPTLFPQVEQFSKVVEKKA